MKNEAASCTGKVRYETFTKARAAAGFLNRNHDDVHAEPYHCRGCHGFHVGTNEQKRIKARNAQQRSLAQ